MIEPAHAENPVSDEIARARERALYITVIRELCRELLENERRAFIIAVQWVASVLALCLGQLSRFLSDESPSWTHYFALAFWVLVLIVSLYVSVGRWRTWRKYEG